MVMDTKFLWVSSAPFGLPVEPSVNDGGQIVGAHGGHALVQFLVRNSHAQTFERAQRVALDHENLLQGRTVVLTESSRSKRSRLSAKASLTAESFMMRWACGAESVS